jgi:predicted DNA binding CopG/RHH family protein
MANKRKEIKDYDNFDTTEMIDSGKPLKLSDLGLKIPATPPTQVVSIRLPTALLNQLKAMGSQDDVPYQALIKLILAEGVKKRAKKSA